MMPLSRLQKLSKFGEPPFCKKVSLGPNFVSKRTQEKSATDDDKKVEKLKSLLEKQEALNDELTTKIAKGKSELSSLQKSCHQAEESLKQKECKLAEKTQALLDFCNENKNWLELSKRKDFFAEFEKTLLEKDFIEEALESELRCAVCMEPIISAKIVVNCGHVFCHHCLTKWCNPLRLLVNCPVCRAPIGEEVRSEVIDKVVEMLVSQSSKERFDEWNQTRQNYAKEVSRLESQNELRNRRLPINRTEEIDRLLDEMEARLNFGGLLPD